MRRLVIVCFLLGFAASSLAQWDPARFAETDTIELHTTDANGDGHWSTVWVVVIDDEVYVRLGNRAVSRIEGHSAPTLEVRLDGEVFDSVRAESVPEMAERVGDAMAEKYWSDLFIRFVAHPMTLRLVLSDA